VLIIEKHNNADGGGQSRVATSSDRSDSSQRILINAGRLLRLPGCLLFAETDAGFLTA
jgi:hypothetical protein